MENLMKPGDQTKGSHLRWRRTGDKAGREGRKNRERRTNAMTFLPETGERKPAGKTLIQSPKLKTFIYNPKNHPQVENLENP